jgi:uncharacterized protein YbjT (DUF2867 family)
MSSPPIKILVASATATTGSQVVHALSRAGSQVRAMVRKLDDIRAKALAALPGVEVVVGDFDDAASIAAALAGTKRALLVSGAFSYEQFERETLFIEAAAAAGLEAVVRIGTASPLVKPGTKGAYGRCHHGIDAFIAAMNYKVITLNPNWYLSNWMSSAGEAKATGKISLPVSGTGSKSRFIDPRDVGGAAAAILTLSSSALLPFIEKRNIEVHGPTLVNLSEKAAALSLAVGYKIEINQVPVEAWVATLHSYGLPRVWATSFAETVLQVDGVTPKGYPSPTKGNTMESLDTSPELLAIWKPEYTIHDWANSNEVKAAFTRV